MSRRYPKEFYVQRKRILARDGYRCVMCWRSPQPEHPERWRNYGLDVHHMAYWRYDGATYTNANLPDWCLVTLCDSCHGKAATAEKGSPFYKALESYLAQFTPKESPTPMTDEEKRIFFEKLRSGA